MRDDDGLWIVIEVEDSRVIRSRLYYWIGIDGDGGGR